MDRQPRIHAAERAPCASPSARRQHPCARALQEGVRPLHSSLCARPDLCDSGFVEEGRDREANFQDGKWSDNVRMAILDREWKAL
jgi:hypothetical protein